MASTSPQPVERLLAPLRDFAHTSASGGVLLMASTAIALTWANSPLADGYTALWSTEVSLGVADVTLRESLLHWVNDGLMAIFFLVVGLEIKREVLVGELASPRRAALPIGAAIGGAIVPALIFLALAGGGAAARGWACRWPPISPSPSAFSPCSVPAHRSDCGSSSRLSQSSTTFWPSW
ncbi:MAG TPA: Na+/H+ antiporter NhaA [Candidatus Limnocylindrales bacterium]|nr:Na+/H+ antiporter NhaA [Candidatus Limnocylindrales bacterium]